MALDLVARLVGCDNDAGALNPGGLGVVHFARTNVLDLFAVRYGASAWLNHEATESDGRSVAEAVGGPVLCAQGRRPFAEVELEILDLDANDWLPLCLGEFLHETK